MKRKFARVLLVAVMVLSFFFSNFHYVKAAVTYNFSNYKITAGKTTDIREDDEITIRVIFSNNSNDTVKNLTLEMDENSAFQGTDGNTFSVPANQRTDPYNNYVDMKVKYLGTTDKLLFNLIYEENNGTKGTKGQSVTITEAIPSNNQVVPPPPGVDSSKYVPILAISGDNTLPVIPAGSSQTIQIPIKNNSSNTAANVKLVLEPEDKTKNPLLPSLSNLSVTISQIVNRATKNAEFAIKVRPDAAPGVYAFKLNYQFSNQFGDPFTSTDTIYIKVENDNMTARLSVSKVDTSPQQALPGQKLKLTLSIANGGSFDVKDVKMTLGGLKSDGFALDHSTDVRRIAKIAGGGTQKESFDLTVSNAILGGSQPLSVKWEYKDESGTLVTEESQIFIPVNRGQNGAAALVLDNIKAPTATLKPTDKFTVSLSVKNAGKSKAENVKVSVTGDKEIVPTSLSTVIIPELAAGASKPLNFTLSVAPDTVTKNYPIAITVEYDDLRTGTPVKVSLMQYVGVYVEGKSATGEDKKSVPRIIINQYNMDPGSALAGQDFKLSMSFLNTSKTMNVRNVKVTATSDDGIFTVDGSNTFFADSIPINATMEKTLTLRAKPDAEQKMYALTLNFEYEDDKGNPFTTKETVSIAVVQNARLTIGELANVTEAFVGQPIPVSINFYNMGKAILYNLMVSTEGEFQSSNANYYVGNFASGRSDSMETSIIPNAAGELTGEFVFAYEDAAGKSNEIRKPFKIQVNEMPPMEPMPGGEQPPMEGPDANKGKWKTYLYIGVPALLVIGGAVTALVIRKKRRKRKELELDEEI